MTPCRLLRRWPRLPVIELFAESRNSLRTIRGLAHALPPARSGPWPARVPVRRPRQPAGELVEKL